MESRNAVDAVIIIMIIIINISGVSISNSESSVYSEELKDFILLTRKSNGVNNINNDWIHSNVTPIKDVEYVRDTDVTVQLQQSLEPFPLNSLSLLVQFGWELHTNTA